MTVAIWIIAVCEVVRALQNLVPIIFQITERKMRKDLNNQFIDSLQKDNKEWVRDMLDEFEKREGVGN